MVVNPISSALHPIPKVCPICKKAIEMVDGKFTPAVEDVQLDGKWTAAHQSCIQK